MTLYRRLKHALPDTERRFVELLVDFDVLRTRLVDLMATYRAERRELILHVPQDLPESMLEPVPTTAVPPTPPKPVAKRRRKPQRKAH